ncbi:hypothetical protein OJ996_18465 [Luteolibacter sp. GHJ8]|uniref:Uncharacterized protein n=1 Tax=Luteolibacter rhizosphaerae TaxID=2989719 RepID=A0ABT3G6U6_9BACT|nr:hypothetical protein [Luteolibacter rhizosphaerae]MCW1915576.1 hypothetical protein [Luteolibacter rhizosphaerae]
MLLDMVEHILYAFNQASAVFVWAQAKEENPLAVRGLGKHWPVIHNASLESTLINMRALNEFFRAPGVGKPPMNDDVRASDYPNYITQGSFLTTDNEKTINKHLAHISVRRAEVKPEWLIRTLIDSAFERMVHFLGYLLRDFPPLHAHHPQFMKVVEIRDALREYTPIGRIYTSILGKK